MLESLNKSRDGSGYQTKHLLVLEKAVGFPCQLFDISKQEAEVLCPTVGFVVYVSIFVASSLGRDLSARLRFKVDLTLLFERDLLARLRFMVNLISSFLHLHLHLYEFHPFSEAQQIIFKANRVHRLAIYSLTNGDMPSMAWAVVGRKG